MNIGLVGFGFIGKTHLEAYEKISHCTVKAICTKSGKAENLPNHFTGSITTDFEDLITDPEIDIIDICLPTYLHEEYIIKAAEAKKNMICEKPLTLTTTSAKKIIDVVNNNKVQLYVGHVVRFWPEYQLMKSHYPTEKRDSIQIVQAHRLGQAPNWSTWFKYPEKSGGALYDLHIHDIDFTYYLLGDVDAVYAAGIKNDDGAWVHLMTTLHLKSGAKAMIEASHLMPQHYPFSIGYRAQADDSTIELTIKAGENIENIDQAEHSFYLYQNGSSTPLQPETDDAFYNQLSYFIDCIRENKPNNVIPLADVLYTLQILEAIDQSLQTGKVINL